MKVGIISDIHGRIPLFRRAIEVLTARGAEAFILCGDLGGLEVLDEMAGRRCWFVWGNTDSPRPSWKAHVEALGLPWPSGPMEITLEGKRLIVFHGNERALALAAKAERHDYLLHGHTHEQADYHLGPMRVINPGALERVSVPTVALLDLATDHVEFVELKE